MSTYCGANCADCGFGKSCGCKGCVETEGCPFGKPCLVANYIKVGGSESFESFKRELCDEINRLGVAGLPKITELYALVGAYVNLSYPMPSGQAVKLLDDCAIYLGNQVECEFNDGTELRCFGIVASAEFILISEYGENGKNPQLVGYWRR